MGLGGAKIDKNTKFSLCHTCMNLDPVPAGTEQAYIRSNNFNGGAQTSGGRPLALHRSGGFESEIYGNYNTLGWLFSVRERAARANCFSAAPRASDKSFKSRAIYSTGHPWRPTVPGPICSRSSKAIRCDFPSAFIAPSSFLELISPGCNRGARRCG